MTDPHAETHVIVPREDAIRAGHRGTPGATPTGFNVVLLAGKGHERPQHHQRQAGALRGRRAHRTPAARPVIPLPSIDPKHTPRATVNTMTRFLPILLGSDINVYGMARAFHEAYGITSRAYAYFQLSPHEVSAGSSTSTSSPTSTISWTFRDTMLAEGKRLKQEDPDRALLLIPCGDVYANLLSQCGDDLKTLLRVQHARHPAVAQAGVQVHVSTGCASSTGCPIPRPRR